MKFSINHKDGGTQPFRDASIVAVWIPIALLLYDAVGFLSHRRQEMWMRNLILVLGTVGIVFCAAFVWFIGHFLFEKIAPTKVDTSRDPFLALLVREINPARIHATARAEYVLRFEHISDTLISRMINESQLQNTRAAKDVDDSEMIAIEGLYRSGGGITVRAGQSKLGAAGKIIRGIERGFTKAAFPCPV